MSESASPIEMKAKAESKDVLPYMVTMALVLGIFVGVMSVAGVRFFSNVVNGNDDTEEAPQNEKRVISNNINSTLDSSRFYDESYLGSVIEVLQQRYLGELPDINEANYELVKGYINALDDQYTNYFDPEEAEIYLEARTSDFEGVGITLSYDGNYTFVESVLKGFPAEDAGILSQDLIIAVDGEDVIEQLPIQVAQKIRGEKDTVVEITVLRENSEGFFDEETFAITRKQIEVDNVMWRKLENNIIEIDISQFSDEDVRTFVQSWDNLVEEIIRETDEINGIVIDLRNNPGGFVLGVRHVTEEFLDQGKIIMQEKDLQEDVTTFEDNRRGMFEDVPVVVLVNEGSASASEIFAAAIMENDRGIVIGMETVGKGVEQELLEFEDGSILLVVFQRWLTPDGNEISEESPIKPDIEIENTIENIRAGEDPQLDRAIEELKNLSN